MAGSSTVFPGAPRAVSQGLFTLAPDRDERMQQVAMELLLTCHQNGYRRPDDTPKSPRRPSLLLRGLVLGENFTLAGDKQFALAERLARGDDFAGSDGMKAIHESLAALRDPATIRGGLGTHLMLPVHQSLLWYDARRRNRTWDAQFVLMRGTGITLARFLLDPPDSVRDLAGQAAAALAGIREALGERSPYGTTVDALASAQDCLDESMGREELAAWEVAADAKLAPLGRRLIRHAAAIMADGEQPGEVRLLHLRRIVALDVAWHMLSAAWAAGDAPRDDRYVLLCHAPQERPENRARVMSEGSFRAAQQALSRGVMAELRSRMKAHHDSGRPWKSGFFLQRGDEEKPSPTSDYYDDLTTELDDAEGVIDFDTYAGRAFDAPGDGYVRPIGAFRVMLESCGLLRGTGQYRYLRAVPSLIAAMVSARPNAAPQEAEEFFAWVRDEWSIIVGDNEASGSALRGEGSVLKRNAEYFERDMVSAGLATALSDQTCMVALKR